jgi:hypothetical protein
LQPATAESDAKVLQEDSVENDEFEGEIEEEDDDYVDDFLTVCLVVVVVLVGGDADA